MLRKDAPEVLVVGAGPVGLYATSALVRRGIDVQVVDRDWRTGAHSYALALHGRSRDLLNETGLLGEIAARTYRVERIGFYQGSKRRAELELSLGDRDLAVSVLPQDVLEHRLEETLSQAGAQVHWNHEVSALQQNVNRVGVTVDQLNKDSVGYGVSHTEWVVANSRQYQVPLVLAADGHRSSIRRMLRIEFEEVGPPMHFAVFEFKTDFDLGPEMRVVLGDQTTDAVWPLPDGSCRWSFQLPDYEAPRQARVKDRIGLQLGSSQYPVLSDDNLRSLLTDRAPWFEGEIQQVDWRLVVRFEHRLARQFGAARTWLAGDAGHMTGPVGMQSMNVGLREARDLAELYHGILREGQSLEQLEDYHQQRRAEWSQLLGQQRAWHAGPRADAWVRDRAARLPMCIPASGNDLAQLLGKLGLQ
jgi:2-polyprenyl-6-methoxyphenol hydroxylase-like FAD-dependent oxidoreductase